MTAGHEWSLGTVLDTDQAWDNKEWKVDSFVDGGCLKLGPGYSPCYKLLLASVYFEMHDECFT